MKKINPLIISIPIIICLLSCSKNEKLDQTSAENQGYHEPHRPQFHFSPPSMWMNDPNGMVYHEGEYHLFYQYNPDTTVWGPMHWGHAISKDMVHWEHLPIALYPDSLGTIFSGSAVIDRENTSGLGTADNPPMVAIFTYHNAARERAGANDFQSQGIAFSLDNGRSWAKYKDNPVLPNPDIRDFRDPKVMWYEEGQKWIMTLAVADHISFYSSPDLKKWTFESDFGQNVGAHGGVWECPDLFKMTGSEEERWVLLVSINPGAPNGGSGTQYFIGQFDGTEFIPDEDFVAASADKGIWLDYGRDNYAGVTWSNVPREDGRRLFMGWMSNWAYANVVPTEKWRSAMTVARKLTLAETEAGLRVLSSPVKELERIRAGSYTIPPKSIEGAVMLSKNAPFQTPTFELDLELEQNKGFTIELSNAKDQKVSIGWEPVKNQYFINRTAAGSHTFSDDFAGVHYAPRISSDSTFSLKLLVDVASVEFFADAGKTVMTDIFFPDEPFTNIKLIAKEGEVLIKSGSVYKLESIW